MVQKWSGRSPEAKSGLACEIGAKNCHEWTLGEEDLKEKRREEGARFFFLVFMKNEQ